MDTIVAIFFMFFASCSQSNNNKPSQPEADIQLPKAEFPAEFPTGQNEFNHWLWKNTEDALNDMPEEEVMNCTTLRVQFIVKKDGIIAEVRVLNDITAKSKQKMQAAFYKMPKWKPATLKGKPVDYLCKISGCILLQ